MSRLERRAQQLVVRYLKRASAGYDEAVDEEGPKDADRERQLKAAARMLERTGEYAASLPSDDPIFQRIAARRPFEIGGALNVSGEELDADELASLRTSSRRPYRHVLKTVARDVEGGSTR